MNLPVSCIAGRQLAIIWTYLFAVLCSKEGVTTAFVLAKLGYKRSIEESSQWSRKVLGSLLATEVWAQKRTYGEILAGTMSQTDQNVDTPANP